MSEAKLDKTDNGVVPSSHGWFVINAKDSVWWGNERFGVGTQFEDDGEFQFKEIGIHIHVLEPGQSGGMYHSESAQEDFMVLNGECVALIEGEERPMKRWDFLHCPPGTEHMIVGAGSAPCTLLMIGARSKTNHVNYPVAEVAKKYDASVLEETDSAKEAYKGTSRWTPRAYDHGLE
jgi:uncharacterized cupin superfamily protein